MWVNENCRQEPVAQLANSKDHRFVDSGIGILAVVKSIEPFRVRADRRVRFQLKF